MKKSDDLRTFLAGSLAAAYPASVFDPERMQVFIEKGSCAMTGVTGLGVQYAYDLVVLLLDFPGSPDAVFLPLAAWLARNQPDALQSYSTNPHVLRFELDLAAHDKVDLQVTIPLTESVTASPGPGGAYVAVHHPEPEPDEHVRRAGEHFEIWSDGVQIASWTEPDAPPGGPTP